MDVVTLYSDYFLKRNFKKVISELNFQNGISGYVDYEDGEWLEVKFENEWRLIVWSTNKYSMIFHKMYAIHKCSYDELLEFMEYHGMKKKKRCTYNDAELYILDFGKQ